MLLVAIVGLRVAFCDRTPTVLLARAGMLAATGGRFIHGSGLPQFAFGLQAAAAQVCCMRLLVCGPRLPAVNMFLELYTRITHKLTTSILIIRAGRSLDFVCIQGFDDLLVAWQILQLSVSNSDAACDSTLSHAVVATIITRQTTKSTVAAQSQSHGARASSNADLCMSSCADIVK